MPKTILVMKVESIQVQSNGDPADEAPNSDSEARNNAIIANLKYPRSGAPNVSTTLPINLRSGQELRFDLENFWDSGLFKEEIFQESILSIHVTDSDKVRKLDKFLARFFQTVIGAGLGVLTGGISNAIVGAVANLPVEAIKGSFQIDKDARLDVIGSAEARLVTTNPSTLLELDLVAPKTIRKTFFAFEKPGATKVVKKTETLIQKDEVNGHVRLSLEWIEA